MKRRYSKNVVRVHVPRSQSSFIFVPGEHGGWFASLLYGHGRDVDVDVPELLELIAGSRGSVIIGRRLAGAELRMLESYIEDVGAEVHARIVPREELRFLGRGRRSR